MIIIKLGSGQRELSFLFIQPRFTPFPLNLLGKYYEKSCDIRKRVGHIYFFLERRTFFIFCFSITSYCVHNL